jgi:hypothetical protein
MATDDFTGTNGDLLRNRSGWGQTLADIDINSNRINANNSSGGFSGAVYTGADLTADHSSSLLTQVTGYRSIGPTTRATASTGTCYFIRSRYDYNSTDLCEIAADGTISMLDAGDLDSGSQTWRLDSDGDQHSVYLNGSTYGSIASPVTDGTLTTGNPGVGGVGTNGNTANYGDDWEGLTLGGGGGPTGSPWYYYAH